MRGLSEPDSPPSSLLRVALDGHAYDIAIGPGLLGSLPRLVPFPLEGRAAFLVSDSNVAPLYASLVEKALASAGVRSVATRIVPAGEESKSFAQLQSLLGWLLDRGVDRKAVLFALGGGVVGDLAGFAAAIVLRGIPYIQLPTTLLAQVDSAVGGKTAIDVPQGKNLVGAFHQPAAVVVDTAVLETLPLREMRAGYAEIVKYGLLGDSRFFAWLEEKGRDVLRREPAALCEAIETSCRTKAAVVAEDALETSGRRALLNLGHTFGHAFEALAGFGGALLHGEAVAIGMVCALDLSVRLGLCPPQDLDRAREHIAGAGLPVAAAQIPALQDINPAACLDLMKGDKKAENGRLTLILARGIGQAFVARDVPIEAILETLKASSR